MKIRRSESGFTLMELILVIVLLSIVSLYAAPRFFGKSSFSVYALQDQVVSVVRQVQLNRMQSNITDTVGLEDISDNFRLYVSDKCIGSVVACDLKLQCDDNDNSSSCKQVSARSDFVADEYASFSVTNSINPVEFDLLGNPSNSNNGDVVISIQEKNGGRSCEVEINSQGYVSKGDCS